MNFNINQNNINANAKTLDELQAQMGDKDNGENAAWLQKLTPGTRAALASGEPLTDAQKSEITYVIHEEADQHLDPALTNDQKKQLKDGLTQSILGLSSTETGRADLSKMSIQELLFFVMSERAEQLENQVRAYAEDIQARNAEMKQVNNFLVTARTAKSGIDGDDGTATMPYDMAGFMNSNGIESPGSTGNAGGASGSSGARTQESIQAEIDELNAAKKSADDSKGPGKSNATDEMRQASAKYDVSLPKDGNKMTDKDIREFENNIENKIAELEVEKGNAPKQADIDSGSATGSTTVSTTGGGRKLDKDQWQSVIDNLKGHLEGLNNQSQIDMIKYQSVMSKYTAQIEMLSNSMKKLDDAQMGPVRNIN